MLDWVNNWLEFTFIKLLIRDKTRRSDIFVLLEVDWSIWSWKFSRDSRISFSGNANCVWWYPLSWSPVVLQEWTPTCTTWQKTSWVQHTHKENSLWDSRSTLLILIHSLLARHFSFLSKTTPLHIRRHWQVWVIFCQWIWKFPIHKQFLDSGRVVYLNLVPTCTMLLMGKLQETFEYVSDPPNLLLNKFCRQEIFSSWMTTCKQIHICALIPVGSGKWWQLTSITKGTVAV